MYNNRVPRLLNRVQLYDAKFPTQLRFINIMRNTNLETQEYKEINFSMKGHDGKLAGEFIKATDIPHGRCRFMT